MKMVHFTIPAAISVLAGAVMLLSGSCERRAAHTVHEEAVHAEHSPADTHAEGAAQDDHEAENAGRAEDAHAGHAGESGAVELSDAELREYGIEVMKAGPGAIETQAGFPGEIVLDADRTVRVVPKVGGIVKEVRKSLGDRVRAGETLAVIESRELAETAADYLANRERRVLAQTVYDREEGLRKKDISSEEEFLDARTALAEARILERVSKQKLLALGLAAAEIDALGAQDGNAAMRYEIAAPRSGTVIEKTITVGDMVADDAPVFAVADLETVWADFNVFQKDLPLVREGLKVTVSGGTGVPDAEGKILYVGRVLDPEKRTALARVALPNRDGRWRPGLYVTGRVEVSRAGASVRVPVEAVQTIEGKSVVFVRDEDGFEPRPVTTGAKDLTGVEITDGLAPGDEYAGAGAFKLKARIVTSSLGAHAGHNH